MYMLLNRVTQTNRFKIMFGDNGFKQIILYNKNRNAKIWIAIIWLCASIFLYFLLLTIMNTYSLNFRIFLKFSSWNNLKIFKFHIKRKEHVDQKSRLRGNIVNWCAKIKLLLCEYQNNFFLIFVIRNYFIIS